jgi:tyrosinase
LSEAVEDERLSLPDGPDLGPLTENQLGAATEPSNLFSDDGQRLPVFERYGNLHGGGHIAVGGAAGPGPKGWGGVMNWTESAIRDPFFYSWHRHVDDLYPQLQDAQDENNIDEYAARVRFRDDQPDIVLCLSRDIPGADQPDFDFDAFGREHLGEDLAGAAGFGTTVLLTRFVLSEVTAPVPMTDQPETYWTTHLTHEPFAYFLRVENELQVAQWVTVRAFLVHADFLEDRRMWIELDKFEKELAPGVNVVGRPDARSSVIKRKGVRAPGAENVEEPTTDPWCDCGWPYTLLLPSGASSSEGTPFVLSVTLTDYNLDREPDHTRTCGSMSFCGARQNYPDRRRMGYPFDRPFVSRTIAETIGRQPNMSSVDLTIRCENDRPPA